MWEEGVYFGMKATTGDVFGRTEMTFGSQERSGARQRGKDEERATWR